MTFQIEWTPDEALVALARKNGMPEGEDCPLDYAEVSDASKFAEAKTFDEAVAIAKQNLPNDMFGQVRIEHLVFIKSRYGDRWDADAVWHVSEPNEVLSEDEPEHRPDIDLVLDEAIVDPR